jgi:hypothetical protein
MLDIWASLDVVLGFILTRIEKPAASIFNPK